MLRITAFGKTITVGREPSPAELAQKQAKKLEKLQKRKGRKPSALSRFFARLGAGTVNVLICLGIGLLCGLAFATGIFLMLRDGFIWPALFGGILFLGGAMISAVYRSG